jgi:hypothetical protein
MSAGDDRVFAKEPGVMNDESRSRRRVARLPLALALVLALGALAPAGATAQVPPRFYWKTLSGATAVPLIVNSISGNTNPFDPSHLVTPGANVDATLALPGYARTFTLGGRAALVAVIAPMGRISGEVTAGGGTVRETARGFGDPMLELDVNLVGRPAQKNLVDALRYEPGFSLDLIADLAVPVGEYDNTRALNLGQNRWYGRVGAPILWQLGPWVPGRRTTLELLPAVWLFGKNDDYVGQTLSTDPMFQVDAHLTRGTRAARRPSTASRGRSSTTWESESPSGTRSTTTWASPWATSRPSTTALPGTSRWTGSWSRWWRGGTRSSKARDG